MPSLLIMLIAACVGMLLFLLGLITVQLFSGNAGKATEQAPRPEQGSGRESQLTGRSRKKRMNRNIAASKSVLTREARANVVKKKKESISLGKRLAMRLDRAGLKMKPLQFILGSLLLGAGIILAGTHFAGLPYPVAVLAGGVLAYLLPQVFLSIKISRRKQAFLAHLSDALDIMARGLQAGLPVQEVVRTVGQDLPDPVGPLFATIDNEIRLGSSLEDSMQRAADRIDVQEFQFLATVMTLQRDTGGNLTEVVRNLSSILRRRLQMKLKIQALASEARASAKIMGLLPIVMFGVFMVIAPEYAHTLTDTLAGRIIITIAGLSCFIGFLVMSRMARFEI